mgnify:CR=1 FL=1
MRKTVAPRSASPALNELEQLIRLISRLPRDLRRRAAVRACEAIREVMKSPAFKGGLDLPLWSHDEAGARFEYGPIGADVDLRTKWTFKVREGDQILSEGTANSEEEAKTAASNAVSGIILCNKLTRSDQA